MKKGGKIGGKSMFNKLRYTYNKKHRYLDAYLQDLIASITGFKPHKVKLEEAKKTDLKLNEFNYFEFKYLGSSYKLLDGKLTRLK